MGPRPLDPTLKTLPMRLTTTACVPQYSGSYIEEIVSEPLRFGGSLNPNFGNMLAQVAQPQLGQHIERCGARIAAAACQQHILTRVARSIRTWQLWDLRIYNSYHVCGDVGRPSLEWRLLSSNRAGQGVPQLCGMQTATYSALVAVSLLQKWLLVAVATWLRPFDPLCRSQR